MDGYNVHFWIGILHLVLESYIWAVVAEDEHRVARTQESQRWNQASLQGHHHGHFDPAHRDRVGPPRLVQRVLRTRRIFHFLKHFHFLLFLDNIRLHGILLTQDGALVQNMLEWTQMAPLVLEPYPLRSHCRWSCRQHVEGIADTSHNLYDSNKYRFTVVDVGNLLLWVGDLITLWIRTRLLISA